MSTSGNGSKAQGAATPGSSVSKSSLEDEDFIDVGFRHVVDNINKSALAVPRELPILPEKASQYKPLPYTFRIPGNTVTFSGKNLAKCPPFYVQLDHALAVVWSLFSKEPTERPLGVVQLQWALSFLKGLRNHHGKHPEDILVCMDAMEEALIEQYAELADKVLPACCNSFLGKSHPQAVSLSSLRRATSEFLEKNASKSKTSQLVTQRLPFSVNYAEMSKFKPNHLEQLFKTHEGVSMADVDIQREVTKLKQVVSMHVSDGQLASSSSKDNMVEFLKVFRKEQIGKIQEELKRLHSIETFIGNIDKDNFEPYLNNDQLDVLVAHQVGNGGK